MIYEVLLANTLDRAAIFSGHPYLESTSVLSDKANHIEVVY